MRSVLAVAATLLATVGISMSGYATAAEGVTVSSSGLSSMKTYTYQDSTDGFIVFDIRDPRDVARQVSQCILTPSGSRIKCDSYPLRNTKYRDGSWRVKKLSSGWQVRLYVGWGASTNAQCLAEFPGADEWGLQIGVLSSSGKVLARDSHTYESDCQGYAAEATGRSALYLRVGQDSKPLAVNFTLVDRSHAIRTVRRCFYNLDTEETGSCYRDSMAELGERTRRGWTMTRKLTFDPVTPARCRQVARTNPSYEYRVAFLDRSGNVVARATHNFYLDCSP